MGVWRYVFNKVIDFKEQYYTLNKKSITYYSYRKELTSLLIEESPWVKECPAHTIYGAMMDADKAYKLMVSKRSSGEVCALPRCRRKTQKSFYVLGNCITSKGIYPRLLGKLKAYEPLPNKPSDSRIVCEADKWYLVYPYKELINPTENQGRVVALDPGVRTFLSAFSTNELFKVGSGAFGRIVRLATHLDSLLSRAAKPQERE